MDQHLIFLLLGLANGAVFASLAMALVVTYRSSGVLNFATGTIALYGAYTYAFLRQGQLLVLIPGLPEKVDLGSDLSFWPATLLTLVDHRAARSAALPGRVPAAAGGARRWPRRWRRSGSWSCMTGLMSQRLGTAPVSVDAILPDQRLDPRFHPDLERPRLVRAPRSSASRSRSRPPSAYTRFGLHTRAAAETEKGALVSGIAPDRVAAAELDDQRRGRRASPASSSRRSSRSYPISYTLFIVPALAAAVLGRFQYVRPGSAGGLFIGMLQSEVTYFRSQHTWLPGSGLPELIPLILILLVLVVRAKPLPSRGVILQRTLGRAPRPQRILVPTVLGTVAGALALILLHTQLARRDGDELHLRDHLPVARRRDRLRRTGVAGAAHPGRRRRVPARHADDGMVDPVPHRAHPRGARRDRRRRDRRSPGDPRHVASSSPW